MKKENKQLTGVRGIAAFYVVLYHCFHLVSENQFVKNGYLSVDLFFILSGFVMALSYAENINKDFSFKRIFAFFQNRFARVWPAYFFWLLCNSAYLMYKNKFFALDFIPNVLMVQNLGLSPSIIGTGWSISIEFCSYILFPVVSLLLFKAQPRYTVFLIFIVFSCLTLISKSGHGVSGPLDITLYSDYFTIVRGVGEFILGIYLFIITSGVVTNYSQRYIGIFTDSIFALIIIFLSLKGFDVINVMLFFLLIGGLFLSGKSLTSRILSSKPFHFLGEISYSLYLCHIPLVYFLMDKIGNYIDPVGAFIISIIMLMIISYCSLTVVEKPVRKLLMYKK